MAYVLDRDAAKIRWARERRLFPQSLARCEKGRRKFCLQKKIACAYPRDAGEMHVQTTNRRARRPGGWLTALPEDTVMHLPLRLPTHLPRESCSPLRLPSARIALVMLLLGALVANPIVAHAQAKAEAAPTALPRRATLGNITSYQVRAATDFSCQEKGKVMVSRTRTNTDPVITNYECATVYLDGKEVQVTNEVKSEKYSERGSYYRSDLNRVMTFARQDGTMNSTSQMTSGDSQLKTAEGVLLNIRPGTYIRLESWNLKMNCAPAGAMSARWGLYDFQCAEIWSGNPSPTTPSGTITLRPTTNLPCTLSAPNGPAGQVWKYSFMSNHPPCPNDTAQSIELQAMPSATRILLDESPDCAKDEDLWIELRTTEKSVTSDEPLNLDEFLTFSPGAIVRRGLQLVNYHRKGTEPAVNRLSCVRITTSSAPPTP